MRTIRLTVACVAILVATAGQVQAGIMAQIGSLGSGTITNFEDFDGGEFTDLGLPGNSFSSIAGLSFDLPVGGFITWSGDGSVGFNTRSLYQSGGANSMTSISLTSGANIKQIELDIANGYGPASPQNIWVRAYNDGFATGDDFVFSLSAPGTIAVWTDGGTVFDELRVQSYGFSTPSLNESQFGTASIDNVTIFSSNPAPVPVPEPTSLAIFGIMGLTACGVRRRRSKRTV